MVRQHRPRPKSQPLTSEEELIVTIVHTPDKTRGPVDPATDMLRALLAGIQPRNLAELLDIASLVGDVDGGHITAQTIGGAR